jgi:hypothetical protein
MVDSRVNDLNDSLAEIMHHMTQRTVNKQMLENENKEQDEAVIFAKQCTVVAGCAVKHRQLLDYWFLWLGTVIQKEWTCAIKEINSEDLLEEHVDEKDVDSVLEGSRGMVFYISGYLLGTNQVSENLSTTIHLTTFPKTKITLAYQCMSSIHKKYTKEQ